MESSSSFQKNESESPEEGLAGVGSWSGRHGRAAARGEELCGPLGQGRVKNTPSMRVAGGSAIGSHCILPSGCINAF